MAWNEPGNGGKDRDPWSGGGGGRNQGPPDLDEAVRNMLNKLSALFGGRKSSGPSSGGGGLPGLGNLGLILIAAVVLVIWVISGFYTIREAERGVVLRFGQFYQIVEPGLRWKPTFIDEVIPVDVRTVRSLPASGFMLTMDENVVRVEMDVQYRVVDPRAYLFNVTNANNSLSQATDSALRFVVGHTTMDDILTTGRETVRQETWQNIEQIVEPYNLGLTIVEVNFLPARPPEEVKDAFDDVIAAREDEERFQREAEAYEREIVPRARGQAIRMEQDALAYKERVVQEARGEVAKFARLLPEYLAAPEVTRQRLYLETIEEVLSRTSNVVVDVEQSGNMMFLPLDRMMGGSQPQTASPAREQPQSAMPLQPSGTTGAPSSVVPLRSSSRQGRN